MKRKLLSLISIMALLFASAGLSFAQTDAPAEDAPAKADQPQVIEKSLMDMWNAGGWTMYPLGLFAIFGTTLIIYNAISIRQKKFLNPTGVKEVEKLVGQLQIAEAIEYCEKNPSPITNIIGSGLARADIREIDVQAVESAMEEASVEEFATPYVFINYLSVIASLAPMMGLYGTVSGMVKAFNTIAAEGAGSASKLADNISEALITTATGMIVGIPAMFFFFLFKQSYGKIISSSSRIIGDLVYTMKVAIKYGPQEVEAEEAPAEEAPVEEAPAETQE
ncbi:MAG: MotA/TolQ/ExbB proton channel family protein [Opitutales bacterium]|nr:MotA/TolQ/ExbB proton channel family protein [Opitutales bacterium]